MQKLRTAAVIGGAIAVLFSASAAFAQDESNEGARNRGNEMERKPLAALRPMMASSTATTTRREIGEEERERLQEMRQEMQKKIEEQREKAKQRLEDIKDKAKQQKAEQLTKQFNNLNAEWTDHFTDVLNHLETALQKIQDRATTAAAAGKDVAATTAAIQSAKTAIATARAAVLAQAAKTYTPSTASVTVTVSTTTPAGQDALMKGLRESFKATHTALFKDLFALRDGPMKAARKAVQDAAQTLGKIRGVDDDSATSTSAKTED